MSTESIDDLIDALLPRVGEIDGMTEELRQQAFDVAKAKHADLIKQSQLEELEKAREWCAGGQMCEYSKLVDRIEALNRIKREL